MFRLLMFWLLLSSLSGLRAQLTYEQADYAAPGDTFVLSQATPTLGLNLGQDGAGLNWDVSALQPSEQRVARFGDPDNAGYRLTWISQCVLQGGGIFTCPTDWDALTNLAEDALDQDNALSAFLPFQLSDRTRHYQLGNGQLVEQLLGLSVGNAFPIRLIVEFDQPDTLLTFPMTLGLEDSSQAAYAIDYTNLGAPIASFTQLTRRRRVSATGSLTTPYAVYDSVLKLETIIERRDSIRFSPDSAFVFDQTQVEYAWFDSAYGHPVMRARGNVIGGLPIITEVAYLDTLRCIDPTAFFLALPNPVVFDFGSNSATVNFTALPQNADSLSWNLGDGTVSDANSLSHAYGQPGVYQVRLIACNTTCSPTRCDTFTVPVAVIDTTQPLALFTPDPAEACVGQAITLVNNSINADSYQWDFGDGSPGSTQEAPSHGYSQAGDYTVQLIAFNGNNADTTTREVRIRPAPSVTAGPDTTLAAGQSVQLQSTLSGGPASYAWTPAAGLSCTTCPDPIAQPDSSTSYTLTVTSACGTADASLEITVTPGVGIDTPDQAALRLFPNPTGGRFTVETGQAAPHRWQVADLTGRLLARGQSEDARFSLDLSTLPTGVYTLTVAGPQGLRRALVQVQ